MIDLVWLIPALPLAAFLIDGLFGRRWLGHLTGLIATVAVGLSALLSIGVFLEVLGGKTQTVVALYRWIAVGDFSCSASKAFPVCARRLAISRALPILNP